MAFNNNPYASGYNAYKEVGVKTASQGKLVVMLYEGAINNLEKALALLDENNKIQAKNIEQFGIYIQKATNIISELQCSLNLDQGGEIAKNLLSLYIFFNKQLLDSTLDHDRKKIESVCNMMKELAESWRVAANSTANTQIKQPMQTVSVSIEG